MENRELLQTPSQTVGPYFAYGLVPEQYLYDFKSLVSNQLIDPTDTECIIVQGTVYDGAGQIIPDALIEIWDASHNAFGRFGTGTDPQNRFIFYCHKPLSLDGSAPYLTVIVLMRGQLIHSNTRIYFSDEAELNQLDETLNSVPVERRSTLIAQKESNSYIFDIHMQGEKETVFFDV